MIIHEKRKNWNSSCNGSSAKLRKNKNLRLALECIALVTFCASRQCKWCRWDAEFMTRDFRRPQAFRGESSITSFAKSRRASLCVCVRRFWQKVRQRELILIASVIKMHFSQNRSLKCVGKKRPRASDYISTRAMLKLSLRWLKSRRENKFSTANEHFPQCFLRLWLIEMNDGPNTESRCLRRDHDDQTRAPAALEFSERQGGLMTHLISRWWFPKSFPSRIRLTN